MPHFLLVPVGSHGDVHPFVAIGKSLRELGHRVTMITSEPFRDVAVRNGMEFVPTLSSDEFSAMTHNPDLWHPKKGLKVILDRKLMQKYYPVIFNAIRERVRARRDGRGWGLALLRGADRQRGTWYPLRQRAPSADGRLQRG